MAWNLETINNKTYEYFQHMVNLTKFQSNYFPELKTIKFPDLDRKLQNVENPELKYDIIRNANTELSQNIETKKKNILANDPNAHLQLIQLAQEFDMRKLNKSSSTTMKTNALNEYHVNFAMKSSE